jgi:hypothetical protein
MLLGITLCIVLAIIGGGLLYKRRSVTAAYVPMSQFVQQRRRQPAPQSKPAAQRQAFRGTSIRCGTNACDAAKKLQGKRGLPHQIPKLPLSLCDAEQCTCSYKHHDDRRDDEDRRDIFGSLYGDNFRSVNRTASNSSARSVGNRRSGDDRRADD